MSTSEPTKTPSQYIYKIAPSIPQPLPLYSNSVGPPSAAAGSILPTSPLDKSSGYIHMSTASQISMTLALFFPTLMERRDVVWLLKVKVDAFGNGEDVLKWESPDGTVTGSREGEGLFPHLYIGGGKGGEDDQRLWLRRDEVFEVREMICEVGSIGWEGILRGLVSEGWLV